MKFCQVISTTGGGGGEIKEVKKDILTSKIFWTLLFIVSLNNFVYFPKLGL